MPDLKLCNNIEIELRKKFKKGLNPVLEKLGLPNDSFEVSVFIAEADPVIFISTQLKHFPKLATSNINLWVTDNLDIVKVRVDVSFSPKFYAHTEEELNEGVEQAKSCLALGKNKTLLSFFKKCLKSIKEAQ
jgi:hypothetical protein